MLGPACPVDRRSRTGLGGLPHRHGGYTDASGAFDPHHELFDVGADPTQEHSLQDTALEAHFGGLMRGHLDRLKAPAEQIERLGL